MTGNLLSDHAEAARSFNRFYTRQIGVLDEDLLASPFSLTQARVLFELGTRKAVTARDIDDTLGLDAGYLSRMVQNFVTQGLIHREPSAQDGRQVVLSLTPEGKKAFRQLDRKSHAVTAEQLSKLSAVQRERLLLLMRGVQRTLSPEAGHGSIIIRKHRACLSIRRDAAWASANALSTNAWRSRRPPVTQR